MKKILVILVMLVSLLILVGCEDRIFWGESKIEPPQWIQGTYYKEDNFRYKFEFTSNNVIEIEYNYITNFNDKADKYSKVYSYSKVVNGKNLFVIVEDNKYISNYTYTFTDLGDNRIGIYKIHSDKTYDKGIYTK